MQDNHHMSTNLGTTPIFSTENIYLGTEYPLINQLRPVNETNLVSSNLSQIGSPLSRNSTSDIDHYSWKCNSTVSNKDSAAPGYWVLPSSTSKSPGSSRQSSFTNAMVHESLKSYSVMENKNLTQYSNRGIQDGFSNLFSMESLAHSVLSQTATDYMNPQQNMVTDTNPIDFDCFSFLFSPKQSHANENYPPKSTSDHSTVQSFHEFFTCNGTMDEPAYNKALLSNNLEQKQNKHSEPTNSKTFETSNICNYSPKFLDFSQFEDLDCEMKNAYLNDTGYSINLETQGVNKYTKNQKRKAIVLKVNKTDSHTDKELGGRSVKCKNNETQEKSIRNINESMKDISEEHNLHAQTKEDTGASKSTATQICNSSTVISDCKLGVTTNATKSSNTKQLGKNPYGPQAVCANDIVYPKPILPLFESELNPKPRKRSQSSESDSAEIASENSMEPSKCRICREFMYIQKPLKQQFSVSVEKVVDVCSACNICFLQKSNLPTDETKPFQCVYCYKRFPKKGDLQVHEKSHIEQKPFKCKDCDRTFGRKANLTLHSKIHKVVEPFVCTVCKKEFVKKAHLNSHFRAHTGELRKVDKTRMTFDSDDSELSDLDEYVEESPFNCLVCDKSFKQKVFLDEHLKEHSSGKLYRCSTCNEGFLQRSNLRYHSKTCKAGVDIHPEGKKEFDSLLLML